MQRSLPRLVPVAPSQYVPFKWLLNRAVQHGCVAPNATKQLLAHPDAPAPWDVFEALNAYAYPDRDSALAVVAACAKAASSERRASRLGEGGSPSSSSTAAAFTVHPNASNPVSARMSAVDGLEYVAREILACPRLSRDGAVLDATCRALLIGRHFDLASIVFLAMDPVDVTQATWAGLIRAARLGNTDAVERLVAPELFPLAWELSADAASQLMLWGGPTGGRTKACTALLILRRYLAPTILAEAGVPMPCNTTPLPLPGADSESLSPAVTEAVRAIEAWSSAAETTPGSIMDRLDSHVNGKSTAAADDADGASSSPDKRRRKRRTRRDRRTPELTQRQWGQGSSAVGPVNPIPLRVFFEIARAKVTVADGALDTTALHWRIQWRAFQLLNRAAPQWYNKTDGSGEVDGDAEQMVFQVIDALTRGASPWLAFNLAHHASYLGIVDGVDIALYLLMRTHRGEYAEHGAAVAKLVFNWLLGTAAIYRRPERQTAVINACRVLIQLGMQQELSQLYELVVENVSEFDPEYRANVAKVLGDVTCPSCHSMLPSNDPHIERACHVCGDLVAARPVTERASFEMSEEARERLRARSLANQKARSAALVGAAKKLRDTPKQLSPHIVANKSSTAASSHHSRPDLTSARTTDSAQLFKESVLAANSPAFGSASEAVWVGSSGALAPEELQVLRQRGDATASAAAAVPLFSNAVVPSRSPAHDDITGNTAGDSNKVRFGPWSCCWCGERNDGMARRDSCSACGAYSGPAAEWRVPVGAPGRDGKFDPIEDFRARVKLVHSLQQEEGSASSKSIEVALGAGMHLLVYRRAFALRANKADGDYALVNTVVEVLCRSGQRVLAAAVYFGLIPLSQRQVGSTLSALATAFGKFIDFSDQEAVQRIGKALGDTRTLVRQVLGENICVKCYGAHSVTDCALVTRKFKASAKQTPGGMTPEAEKPPTPEKRAMQLLARMDANVPPTVLTAYAAFLSLEDRDGFAQQHAPETNFLALMLRHIDNVKRSALVACHLPLHVRTNDVLRGLCSGFAVELEEYREMIAKRTVGDASTHHPNFVQLTRTCCICFDGQHASHACPKLLHWLHDCAKADSPDDAELFKPAQDSVQAAADDKAVVRQEPPSGPNHRRAAVAGWTGSGPERLLAFSKFLLNRIDAISGLAAKSDVIAETLNLVIVKLAASGQESHAFRLYAWSPMPVIQRTTTATLLRVRNFDDAIVEQGLKAGATGSDWRLVALPSTACLMCFREGHSFHVCPELQYLSNSARWLQIIQSVASFKLSNVGILAAAQAITYDVLCGKLTTKRIRESPELGKALCRLAHKCFAAGIPRHGAAFLRVLPVELLSPALHVSLWRAAGKTADAIERDMRALEPALDRFSSAVKDFSSAVSAQVTAAPAAPPKASPRRGVGVNRAAPSKPAEPAGGAALAVSGGSGLTAAGRALRIEAAKQALTASQADYRRASTAGVCHRCFGAGHEAVDCELHQAEVLFGRDMIAAFRMIAMDDHHFTPADTYATTLQYARFIAEYHRQLPYHISSVTRAANAVAALLAMMGNAPAALRVLLYIPASFRASHVFAHILARYDLPLDRIETLIGEVDTPADPSSDGAMTTERQVLNIAPQPDLALEKVFHVIPNVDDVIASGEHELAATDVTDVSQPTKVACAQHCTMHDLSEALLERITKPLEERTGTTFGSRMMFLDVTVDEDLDLLDNPGPADDGDAARS